MIFLFLPGILALYYLAFCVFPTFYCKWKQRFSPLAEKADKRIMLTFDDGPDRQYTDKLLRVLAEHHVRAVFFVVARKAARNPELIRRMLDGGHLIGLHALEHKSAWLNGWFYMKRDFEESLSILNHLGCRVRYYRPPWGHLHVGSLILAKKFNLSLLLWTVMAQDWEKASTSQRVLQRLLRRTKNGSIICLHDSGEGSGGAPSAPQATIEALSAFLPMMLQSGYHFILPDAGAL